jgi:formylglycine-generating enzyme required for sulfatase activity
VYPWGSQWEEGRANTTESRLGRTTAVGMYPKGASAQGAMDLAGNVWEWCLDTYEEPSRRSGPETTRRWWSRWWRPQSPAASGSGRETIPRVLRGGSWLYLQFYARASYRFDFDPDDRNYFIGFRVVCVSPIP